MKIKAETCQTCIHWTACLSYKDIYDTMKDFSANGMCRKHSDVSEGNALAVCNSEGILGDFITKKKFGCNEYEFDKYWAKRLLDENREYSNNNCEWARKRRRETRRRIKEELQKIRGGMKNGMYIPPTSYYCPKRFNSITDLLTKNEKSYLRELEVISRTKTD